MLNAQTSTAQRQLIPVPQTVPATQHGSYYALVIGIDAYGNGLTRLTTPLNDARDIAAVLQNNYGFVTKLLTEATRDQIVDALDDYRANLTPNDNLLIYYAGHGWYDQESDTAYWIPIDGKAASRSRWIDAVEITGTARAMRARHVLIISDSCYSGRLTDRDIRPTIGDPREHNAFLEKMLQGTSRHVMSSGGSEPVADGDAPGHSSNHSVFANALLQGLRHMPASEFSADDLFREYVREQVAGRSSQLPEYTPIRNSGHLKGDFVFFRAAFPDFSGNWEQVKVLHLLLNQPVSPAKLFILQDGAYLWVRALGLPFNTPGASSTGAAKLFAPYEFTVKDSVATGTSFCPTDPGAGFDALMKSFRTITLELRGPVLVFTTISCPFLNTEFPISLKFQR